MKLDITPQRKFSLPRVDKEQLKCPVCGSTNIQYDPKRGEYVCMDCGAVIEDSIVMENGERMDFTKKFGARVGPPQDKYQSISHPSTEIGTTQAQKISRFMRRRLGSMKRTNYYASQSSKDRNWRVALQTMDRIVHLLKIKNPAVIQRAKRIYREVLMKGINRGTSIEKGVLACILLASKLEDYPLSIDEIAKATGTKKRDINSLYKKIKRELGITQQEIDISMSHYIDKIIVNYNNHSAKYRREAQELFIPEVVLLAKRIAETAHALGVTSGKKRISVAAAALYLAIEAFGKSVAQAHISEASGVTEVTIRNRSRDIKKKIDIDEMKKEVIEELYGDENG